MQLKLFLVRAARAVRRDGISRTLRAAVSYIATKQDKDSFDSRHGTDTSGIVPLWRLKIDSPNARFGWRYETSDPRELEHCVRCIPADPSNLAFIDMGCGKGRMLIAAKELGFRKLIGVEFAPELVRVAKSNLAKAGAGDAIILQIDASEFHFPREGDSLVYFFNPFSEEVMKRVLENLRRALPMRGFVVYRNARCADLLDTSGFLERIACIRGPQYPTIIWSMNSAAG